MDYDDALAYLDRHIGRGMKPGLDRIKTLLDMMGHPEDGYPIVHIAGTNGKTSTSRIATMILAAHGLNTGTFTSPHLERIEERIGANGRTATPEEFAQAVTDVAAFADIYEARRPDELTYFELTAAMAFAWFAELAVDVAVVEVGLGGRLDATNAARGDVCVLTGIDYDHTETLGTTLAAIATEKLGIVKPGAVLVTGPLPEEAEQVVREVVGERDVRHLRYGRDFRLEDAARAVGGWQCHVAGSEGDYDDIFFPLHGRHQTRNLSVAVAAAEALLGRALDVEALRLGAGAVTSPGRLEPIADGPLVMLDGAHNPQGFRVLAEALAEEFPRIRWVLVVAAMADKDLSAMLPVLAGLVTGVVATTTGSERSMPVADLSAGAQASLGVETRMALDPAEALRLARQMAGPEGAVLVAGSLYLVGMVRSLLVGDGKAQRNER
ncbi:MAG: bifunctional folylpolyglutamate synthase/dihydrofolate synthase [Actinomycetota bacterium]